MNPKLSVADFLLIHYNNTLVIDADFEEDMQLPFKTTQVEFSNTVNLIVPVITALKLITAQPVKNIFFTCNDIIPPLYKCKAIFQPPRC